MTHTIVTDTILIKAILTHQRMTQTILNDPRMTQAVLTDPRMTQTIHRTDTDPGITYGGQSLVLAQVMPTDIIIAYLIFIDLIHVLNKAELLTRE